MADHINSEFIKNVAADLKDPAKIVVEDGPTVSGKSGVLHTVSLPNSIEGDRCDLNKPETWDSSLEVSAKIRAVHQALAGNAGIDIKKQAVSFDQQNGKSTYIYETAATNSPAAIKEGLAQAAEAVGNMNPEHLAEFTSRVNEIYAGKKPPKYEINDKIDLRSLVKLPGGAVFKKQQNSIT